MQKVYHGHCIVQDCEYSIAVDYHDAGNGNYVRGLMDCNYRRQHPATDCSQCTIVKQVSDRP